MDQKHPTESVIDSLSSMTNESLTGLQNLNVRLRQTADRLSGPTPQSGSPVNKDQREPTVVDQMREVREAVAEAHGLLNRIQNVI